MTDGNTAPRWTGRQFHNQPVLSHQHRFLVAMWDAVRRETDGRVAISVHAENDGIAGSDPAALAMLRQGEIEFFTVMGGILGSVVPAMEIQGLPFAFARHEQVHRANDGDLGIYLTRDCAAHGIHRFPAGLLENGFRHLCMVERPIRSEADLVGLKLRVPNGRMFRDFFATLGAEPVVVNIRELYDALQHRRVDGHENPLVITEFNKLYEVTRSISLTAHMWSGFNLVAHLGFWRSLPAEVQAVIERQVTATARAQRTYTDALNATLETSLAARGMQVNAADFSGARPKLAAFYRRWKIELGSAVWSLLEAEVGALG
jgi:tripartite ATP-independent transporter DctP family solute receptor